MYVEQEIVVHDAPSRTLQVRAAVWVHVALLLPLFKFPEEADGLLSVFEGGRARKILVFNLGQQFNCFEVVPLDAIFFIATAVELPKQENGPARSVFSLSCRFQEIDSAGYVSCDPWRCAGA